MDNKYTDNKDDLTCIETNISVIDKEIKKEYASTEDFIAKAEPLEFTDTDHFNAIPDVVMKTNMELYEYHIIKEELVVGPEIIQGTVSNETQLLFEENNLAENVQEKLFKCGNCYKSFSDGESLKKHNHLCLYECNYYHNFFETPNVIAKHIKNHRGTILINEICRCGKKLHSEKCSKKIHKSHICTICHKTFTFKTNLKKHLSLHKKKTKEYKCSHCDKTFRGSSNVKSHIHYVHSRLTMVECEFCKQSYSKKSNLKRHQEGACRMMDNKGKIKSNKELPTYECDICKKVYTSKSTLRKHMPKHYGVTIMPKHYRITIYKCGHCGIEYKSRQSLRRHYADYLDGRCKKVIGNLYSI